MPPGVVHCKYFTASPAHGVWATSALGVELRYLCVTYQSCLQPEKAITEFNPLAFVHSHSSLMKPSWSPHTTTSTSHQPPPNLCLCSWCEECVVEQRKRRCNFDDISRARVILGAQLPVWAWRSLCTQRSFSLVQRGPWLRTHKE